jgi:hypothetical protein
MPLPIRLLCAVTAFAVVRAGAQTSSLPDSELSQPPTAARISAVLAAGRRDGWAPQAAPLRAAALRSYAHANVFTADSWYQLCEWSMLWGETEVDFAQRWVAAVNALKVGHSNMPPEVAMRMVPIGAAFSPDMQAWLLGNRAFSEEFFAHLRPVDYLPKVFEILEAIYRSDPAEFKAYSNLALAIALVYDVPPPPNWPHGQVTPTALPRKLPLPVDAFKWWVHQDQLGRTYQSLKHLPADELKFVVDAAAPAAELEWAQKTVAVPLDELPQVYAMVRYRMERVTKNQPIWPERTYRLPDILSQGGICADQAYFATEVAKAHGVPCLLFGGGGNDARHAWFGYLGADQRWQLDAGRYAEQRFVTGVAYDPQSWGKISDHDLQFLTEHFRALPSYRQSRIHEEFATLMLALHDPAGAMAAARKAVQFEPRHQQAWDTLATATLEKTHEPRAAEAVLREAALAFQRRYPDLESMYVSRVVESLRARGQTSEAEATVRELAQKYQSDRVDISVQQARDIVLRSIASDSFDQQIRTYNAIVDSYGAGAGIAFFDQVVRLFVEHVWQLQHAPEAIRALDHAREVMHPPAQSQLETELNKLQETVTARKKV